MKIEEIKSWNDLTLYLTSTNLSENSLLDIINAEAIKNLLRIFILSSRAGIGLPVLFFFLSL